ncbi:MAG: sigma-70 family RNA polymerase sigma factor [Deltaproteobacteria bacterium]|nr:sigma-70 family RNA polymerase sigma factor [Deltaproteobacteria bacterium]MBI2501296.1 sigma-70 family RNA polymerase sigma factor [Deltaproteobacteria bacterium]MBI4196676.1 sigma-70 family RNA polymerase sigma factor [Deltaproteobacteria bacterium]
MVLKLLSKKPKLFESKLESKKEEKGSAGAGHLSPKEQKDIQKRNSLVEQYLPYATSIAGKVMQTLSSVVDFDDVMCNARLGLIEAAKKFDPTMNVDFKTFSYYRIKGAIYDGLRKTGWIPRSLYAKIKFEQASNEYLQYMAEKQGAAAKVAEQEMGELYDTVNSLASIYVISLDAAEDGQEIEDTKNKDIEQSAEFQQVKRQMKEAIESLPDKERKLIKMYYFQNRTLEEAGRVLNLSKSWTSRLHARALEILFKKIQTKMRTGVFEMGEEQPKRGEG